MQLFFSTTNRNGRQCTNSEISPPCEDLAVAIKLDHSVFSRPLNLRCHEKRWVNVKEKGRDIFIPVTTSAHITITSFRIDFNQFLERQQIRTKRSLAAPLRNDFNLVLCFFSPQNTTYFRKLKVIRRTTCTPSLDAALGLVFVFTRADHKLNGSGIFLLLANIHSSKLFWQNRPSAEKDCHNLKVKEFTSRGIQTFNTHQSFKPTALSHSNTSLVFQDMIEVWGGASTTSKVAAVKNTKL